MSKSTITSKKANHVLSYEINRTTKNNSRTITRKMVRPIIICGASGVGKGTLISNLMKEFPTKFGFSVSHTTRQPRVGEINGVHYHFTNKDKMLKEIEQGLFIEHAHVHTNLYGTSFQAVQDVLNAQKAVCIDNVAVCCVLFLLVFLMSF